MKSRGHLKKARAKKKSKGKKGTQYTVGQQLREAGISLQRRGVPQKTEGEGPLETGIPPQKSGGPSGKMGVGPRKGGGPT